MGGGGGCWLRNTVTSWKSIHLHLPNRAAQFALKVQDGICACDKTHTCSLHPVYDKSVSSMLLPGFETVAVFHLTDDSV